MPPPFDEDAASPGSGNDPPPPSDWMPMEPPWLGLDPLGLAQALGGLLLGLVALFTSYDHLSFAGRTLPLPQQWGIPCIAASVAAIFIDAQLATGSRLRAADAELRAAQDSARAADEAARERDRAAEARERQRESLERLDQAALLSARVQLDPSPTNQERLRIFLTLIGQDPLPPGKD